MLPAFALEKLPVCFPPPTSGSSHITPPQVTCPLPWEPFSPQQALPCPEWPLEEWKGGGALVLSAVDDVCFIKVLTLFCFKHFKDKIKMVELLLKAVHISQ